MRPFPELAIVAFSSLIGLADAKGITPGQIKNLVTFGDSYTDAGVPADNGTAWPTYAAGYANVSLFPFAKSGATCSNNITFRPFPSLFESQLPDFFAEKKNGTLPKLEGKETLYTLWIGTNDVGANGLLTGHGAILEDGERVSVVDTVTCAVNWVKTLYDSGARNFLFQNMIPLQHTPLYSADSYINHYWTLERNTTQWTVSMAELVISGNKIAQLLLKALAPSLSGAHVGLFDSYGLLKDMIANPSMYLNGTAPLNVTIPLKSCVYQLNESTSDTGVCTVAQGTDRDSYLWYDELHPSEQADRMVAKEIAKTFMSNVWLVFAGPTDEGGRGVKQGLITPNAYGTVLDVGAGLGHTIAYLDRTKVTRYVALEPSLSLHQCIRKMANEAGYTESDGSLIILSCGADDTLAILQALDNTPADTIIAVLVACSISSGEKVFQKLIRDVLSPGAILFHMIEHIRQALIPTLKDIYANPYLIFHPFYAFFSNVWAILGPGMDENEQEIKRNLITPRARGVVLDLGAGHGHTIKYLDRSKVKKYIALEPNMCMHSKIREMASSHGFTESDGTFLLIECSASDVHSILFQISTLEKQHKEIQVDTIISFRSACGFPSPENTLQRLVRDVLKPGGRFLFFEHVLSERKDVAWWQRFWAPVWEIVGQCRLDRKTDRWIEEMKDVDGQGRKISMWSEGEVMDNPDEPEESLFHNRLGQFVKHV
ncbi:hypothetical protein D9758_009473 [Tetrapyrgos nigripes]|uniref:Uncharacterized protein n=1 Tax=Tetrapyrgos nigripes TaxID=182062 RepID=A0A8H5LFZ7_9AGAR|nr:hypothetical protein D9758_009473 [Tetrapyrgos nigripes]